MYVDAYAYVCSINNVLPKCPNENIYVYDCMYVPVSFNHWKISCVAVFIESVSSLITYLW